MNYGLIAMAAKRTAKPMPETATVDLPLIGRDEMNLADHPLWPSDSNGAKNNDLHRD
jgi:hypothetical protein